MTEDEQHELQAAYMNAERECVPDPYHVEIDFGDDAPGQGRAFVYLRDPRREKSFLVADHRGPTKQVHAERKLEEFLETYREYLSSLPD